MRQTSMAIAVEYKNLECLKYAHENGCSWDKGVFELAKKRDILNVYNMLMKIIFHWMKMCAQRLLRMDI